ncbi:MAG TPA: Spy/CpxP family protein refolding chaperone [Gemmatimonadaceae bacterium]|nr:Spy/CpxP family protein refolding chaperone [Gemmatimonadaceae bacterium]
MKVIRIATLAAALCVGLTSIAAAQGTEPTTQGQSEARGGRGMGGMLLKDITLTDAQKAQVKTIRDKYVPQQMELRKSAQATGSMDDATRAKMMDLQTKQTAEIRAILTADQQAQFDKNLVEVKARMDARRNGSS